MTITKIRSIIFSMKRLLIGVVIIVIVAVLFFTIQVVKSPKLFNTQAVQITETKKGEDATFIDIKNNISFSYPKSWTMVDPKNVPSFVPIFSSEYIASSTVGGPAGSPARVGYVAIAKDTFTSLGSTEEEIESYSEDTAVSVALKALSQKDIEIKNTKTQKLSYPHALAGFIVDYDGYSNSEMVAKGRIYFYRAGTKIYYAFSAFISSTGPITDTDREVQTFIGNADKALRSFSIE